MEKSLESTKLEKSDKDEEKIEKGRLLTFASNISVILYFTLGYPFFIFRCI